MFARAGHIKGSFIGRRTKQLLDGVVVYLQGVERTREVPAVYSRWRRRRRRRDSTRSRNRTRSNVGIELVVRI